MAFIHAFRWLPWRQRYPKQGSKNNIWRVFCLRAPRDTTKLPSSAVSKKDNRQFIMAAKHNYFCVRSLFIPVFSEVPSQAQVIEYFQPLGIFSPHRPGFASWGEHERNWSATDTDFLLPDDFIKWPQHSSKLWKCSTALSNLAVTSSLNFPFGSRTNLRYNQWWPKNDSFTAAGKLLRT